MNRQNFKKHNLQKQTPKSSIPTREQFLKLKILCRQKHNTTSTFPKPSNFFSNSDLFFEAKRNVKNNVQQFAAAQPPKRILKKSWTKNPYYSLSVSSDSRTLTHQRERRGCISFLSVKLCLKNLRWKMHKLWYELVSLYNVILFWISKMICKFEI